MLGFPVYAILQEVSDWVGGIAQAKEEELWEYAIPPLNEAVTTIVVSLDGAYVLMRDEGYREAMVGTISLYDVTGERLLRRLPRENGQAQTHTLAG